MKLEYPGHACFRIVFEDGCAWVTDPYDPQIGFKKPDVSADYTSVSHSHFDHNCVAAVKSAGKVLDKAGTYDFGKVSFELIPSWHDDVQGAKRGSNLITICHAEGKTLCHLGDLGHVPDAELYARIGKPDLLMIPVGGRYTVDGATAAEIARHIGAKVTVAMHFAVEGLGVGVSGPDAFIEAMGGAVRCGGSLADPFTAGSVLIPEPLCR